MNHQEFDAFCLGLPGVSTDVKWQDCFTYLVGGKIFCCRHIQPSLSPRLSFKVQPERFLELTDQAGISPAPYLGRNGWIQLDHPAVLAPEQLQQLLQTSYSLVRAGLPKKLRETLASLD